MKMKKFINAPETITDEELVGLGWWVWVWPTPTFWTWTAIWLSAATWPTRTG